MLASQRPVGRTHLVALAILVMQEFLQNGMVSFSSSYISGGLGAAPEEFSLAAACYAAIAVTMIFQHRWFVEHLGYRRFLQLAVLFFGLGALLCATANDIHEFILGRAVQAVGGSAFFTAARIQVQHYRGKERGAALMAFGTGLLLGTGIAAATASYLIESASWRAVFVVMIPVALISAVLVGRSVPDHQPASHGEPAQQHAGGFVALVVGIFALQFGLERTQYDFFSNATALIPLGMAAVMGITAFVVHDARRANPLIFREALAQGRYLTGLAAYFGSYLIGSIGAFTLPIFLVRGIGFPVQSTGAILSAASLSGLVVMVLLANVLPRSPGLKKYFLFALVPLFIYGWWMSRMSDSVTMRQLVFPMILHNGVFLTVVQMTAAFGTFRDIDESVFSNAYQVKNALREVASSSGISIATVLMQSRTTLHYERLVETADPLHQLAGASPSTLATFASEVTRQATLMACQDYFVGLCVVALLAALAVVLQRKLV